MVGWGTPVALESPLCDIPSLAIKRANSLLILTPIFDDITYYPMMYYF